MTGQIGEKIEDEKGNMMWLVDFKLDFLNDIEKNGGKLCLTFHKLMFVAKHQFIKNHLLVLGSL